MENFELLEKYITGHVSASEKLAFEKRLAADPSLQKDIALQEQIIGGIKKARISDLKTMLSQVPVGPAVQIGLTTGKMIAGAIAIGAVATSTIFYFKPWTKQSPPPVAKKELPTPKRTDIDTKNSIEIVAVPEAPKKATVPIDIKSGKNIVEPKSPALQPKIEVIDPTEDLTDLNRKTKNPIEKSGENAQASPIKVTTDDANPKYNFHYQFVNGRLTLYGSFDKGLYEVLEVHGDTHSVFLFFKGNYYNLKEKSTITPLTSITDSQLIKKLKEYQSR